jgi:integrase
VGGRAVRRVGTGAHAARPERRCRAAGAAARRAAALDRYVESDPAALVFTGANGGILRRGNFRRASRWSEVVEALGVPGLHFHDLRHTGNTIAAQSGASLRDLMDRMGHDSVRAAMIYQHGSSEAGKAIADSLNDRIAAAVGSNEDDQGEDDDGASGVLVPVA